MMKFWIKSAHVAIALVLVAPLHAQEVKSSLTALYNMRIGATCDELAGSYEKLIEKADSRPLTQCFPETNFSRDEIPFFAAGKTEVVTLEYTPDGMLWSIWNRVTFKQGMGPGGKNTVDSLIKRFGFPPMYSDYSQDVTIRNRMRNHGEEDQWMAAWSSAPAPWAGRINTHVSITPCDALPVSSEAMTECIGRGRRSWESHLSRFRGIVTAVSMTVATNNEGRVVKLWTRMYDPKFAVAAEAFYKKRSDLLLEESKSREKARDAELLPKF
jgi:hypothetical protein